MNFSVTAVDKMPLMYCMSVLQELIYTCQFRSQRSCRGDLSHSDCIHCLLRLTSQCTPFPSLIVCGQHCISYCIFMYRYILEYSGSVKWCSKYVWAREIWWHAPPENLKLHGLTSCLNHYRPKAIDPSYLTVVWKQQQFQQWRLQKTSIRSTSW